MPAAGVVSLVAGAHAAIVDDLVAPGSEAPAIPLGGCGIGPANLHFGLRCAADPGHQIQAGISAVPGVRT